MRSHSLEYVFKIIWTHSPSHNGHTHIESHSFFVG